MSDLTSEEIALFAKVVAKIKENFHDRMDVPELKRFKGFLATLDSARSAREEEAGGKKASNRVAFDAAMEGATALLKTLLARPKPVKAEQTLAKVEWVVTQYDDEGDCEKAAENSGKIVEKAYKRDKSKYLQRDIDEGDLGVPYETSLTTSGGKYALFLECVREPEGKAKMVGVAIGSHSGSGNKYGVVTNDGSARPRARSRPRRSFDQAAQARHRREHPAMSAARRGRGHLVLMPAACAGRLRPMAPPVGAGTPVSGCLRGLAVGRAALPTLAQAHFVLAEVTGQGT